MALLKRFKVTEEVRGGKAVPLGTVSCRCVGVRVLIPLTGSTRHELQVLRGVTKSGVRYGTDWALAFPEPSALRRQL